MVHDRSANGNHSACLAVLQGHTSLVGQLQMRDDILVTGGSDGSVRVWSLTDYQAIHRLAAHDNSVTSLQFDNSRIVSGGSDGRVKIWDLKKGTLVRELSDPAEAVWRVVFEEEKCVIMANRGGKTIMEVYRLIQFILNLTRFLTSLQVWSFSPPDEEMDYITASLSDHLDYDERRRPMSAALPITSPEDGVDVLMADAEEVTDESTADTTAA